jgi:hypothetical protein
MWRDARDRLAQVEHDLSFNRWSATSPVCS